MASSKTAAALAFAVSGPYASYTNCNNSGGCMYKNIGLLATLLATALATTGCALTAPSYTTNYSAVSELKSKDLQPVKVGDITRSAAARNVDKINIRASAYNSPYGSFTRYFQEALRDELDHANLIDAASNTEITGELIRNKLDASGFSIGFVEMEARLFVRRDNNLVYDGAKSIRHEWPSNFLGDIAITRAAANYPLAVRKLLGEFYADPAFIAAIKKP
jgi:hypothetical protein